MLDMLRDFWSYTADTWAVLGILVLIAVAWTVVEVFTTPGKCAVEGVRLWCNRIEKHPGSIWKEGKRELYWKTSFVCSCGKYCKLKITGETSYYRCPECLQWYNLQIVDKRFADKVKIYKPNNFRELLQEQKEGHNGVTEV